MRRARFALGLVAVALLLAGPVAIQPTYAKNYTLKYSDIGPPRGPRAKALMWWAEAIEKDTGGQVKVKFYWAQALVKGKETLKAVGSGLAEMGSVLAIYTPADLPVWNLASVPFGVADIWVGMHTWWEMREQVPEMSAETNRKGVKILSNFSAGPVEILSTKKPILTQSDLQGLKIRATGGWTNLMKSLGAVPVFIGFGELYQALERGTVDATINYVPFVKSYKHYEVADHLTIVGMGQPLSYGPGINLRLWKSMPADLRKVMSERSVELIDQYAQRYLADVETAKRDLTAGINGKKVQLHYVDPAERKKWVAAAAPIVGEWKKKVAKKGIDGDKVYDAFVRIRAKWNQELATKNYPWKR